MRYIPEKTSQNIHRYVRYRGRTYRVLDQHRDRRANHPPLKDLHPTDSLSRAKLAVMRKLSTEEIIKSLEPGRAEALKVRDDGLLLDGHHRVHILRERGVNVDALPREVLEESDQ